MTDRVEPRTLKGFKDYLPEEERLRLKIIDTCREVFELYGFLPTSTPALEYLETLTQKYGEDEKLIYNFKDRGDRDVGLRYDLTVPLARLVSQYQNEIKFPFRRYQIAAVWRAENPQKGRFREFTQADADIVGVESLSADAECVALYYEIFKRLGVENFKIRINSRKVFDKLAQELKLGTEQTAGAIRIIDKFDKIGQEEADRLLEEVLNEEQFKGVKKFLQEDSDFSELDELKKYLDGLGVPNDVYVFDKKIVRGLDYYSGMVFEASVSHSDFGSLGGGGRYVSAVGMSVGVDRLLGLMLQQGTKLPIPATKVLVMNLGSEFVEKSLEILNQLRTAGIASEYFYDQKDLDKQFKYAEALNIPYAVLIGDEEMKKNGVTVRDLKKREQETIKLPEAVNILKKS